jgi:Mg2+/Co2+ transporter CorC
VLKELGRIPIAGDQVTLGPYRLEVIEMDNLRITRVKIERISGGGGAALERPSSKSSLENGKKQAPPAEAS